MNGEALFQAFKSMFIAFLLLELAGFKDSTFLAVSAGIWLVVFALDVTVILLDWWKAR